MSANHNLTERVEEYLAMRRAFGYRLTVAGQLLRDFARFAQRTAPASPLTLDVARGWAQAGRVEERKSAARRLVILRPFARFLRTIEPLTEIPPKGILGRSQHRRAPHIYTDQQLHDLLEATGGLRPCGGLRPRSVRVYLSLLACTGMRPPEPGGWLQRIETAVGRPLFPSRRGERLTRSGVRTRLDTSLTTARPASRLPRGALIMCTSVASPAMPHCAFEPSARPPPHNPLLHIRDMPSLA